MELSFQEDVEASETEVVADPWYEYLLSLLQMDSSSG